VDSSSKNLRLPRLGIKARNGQINIAEMAHEVIYIPPTLDCLLPLVTAGPLQLQAYRCAVLRGCDVDNVAHVLVIHL
jgi:glucosamine 6-phosphate synthetase-like amidotransferase/phosphosugar isomerase protein